MQTYRIPPERLWVVSRGGTQGLVRRFGGALCGRVRVLLARCLPRSHRGGQEAAARGRLRCGACQARDRSLQSRAARPAASWDDVPAVHAVLEGSGVERTSRGKSCLCAAAARRRSGGAVHSRRTTWRRGSISVNVFLILRRIERSSPSTIDSISRHAPVVLLNTPFAVDDHRDVEASGGRVSTIAAHMSPERNLAVQTAVIARARAFVGTYGGYSYLAPFCGVPSLAFYSERILQSASPARRAAHLCEARRSFSRAARCCHRAARAPAVGGPRHRVMKILFVWDSPEYLRFYDSAIEELRCSRATTWRSRSSMPAHKKPVGLEGLKAYADRVRVLGVVPQHDGHVGLDRARPARHHGFRSLSAPALRGATSAARAHEAEGAARGVSLARRHSADGAVSRPCRRTRADGR